jgi:hypothetical protein
MSVWSALIAFVSAMVGYFFSHYLKTRNDTRKEFKEAVKLAFQALDKNFDYCYEYAAYRKDPTGHPKPKVSSGLSELSMLTILYFPNLDPELSRVIDGFSEYWKRIQIQPVDRDKIKEGMDIMRDRSAEYAEGLKTEARKEVSKSWWRREFGL